MSSCVQGELYEECSTSASCPAGERCSFGNCVPASGVAADAGEAASDASLEDAAPDVALDAAPEDAAPEDVMPDVTPDVAPDVAPDVEEEPSCTPTPEVCDGVDNDCDGAVDAEDEGLTGLEVCPNQAGVCSGARALCEGGRPRVCGVGDYAAWASAGGQRHQAGEESLCDGADNDCDGEVDEVCCGASAGTVGIFGEALATSRFDRVVAWVRGGEASRYGWLMEIDGATWAGVAELGGRATGARFLVDGVEVGAGVQLVWHEGAFYVLGVSEDGTSLRVQRFNTVGQAEPASSVALTWASPRSLGAVVSSGGRLYAPLSNREGASVAVSVLVLDEAGALVSTGSVAYAEAGSRMAASVAGVRGDRVYLVGSRRLALDGETRVDFVVALRETGAGMAQVAYREEALQGAGTVPSSLDLEASALHVGSSEVAWLRFYQPAAGQPWRLVREVLDDALAPTGEVEELGTTSATAVAHRLVGGQVSDDAVWLFRYEVTPPEGDARLAVWRRGEGLALQPPLFAEGTGSARPIEGIGALWGHPLGVMTTAVLRPVGGESERPLARVVNEAGEAMCAP